MSTEAPVPSVVPEAAVEAGARTLCKPRHRDPDGWPLVGVKDYCGRCLDLAEAVIAAAFPLLTAAPSATRDEVARLVDPSGWRYFDTGMFPPDHPASTGVVHNSRETADALLAHFTITPKED